jgi:hypothetical protein
MATQSSDTRLKPRPPAKLPATPPPGAIRKELPTAPQVAAKRAAKAGAALWHALMRRIRKQDDLDNNSPSAE